MNYKDVIETLKKCFMPACDYHVVNRCNLSLEERFMKHSDVLDMAIESIEKQIPKKPNCYEDKYMHCATCDEHLAYKWLYYPKKLNEIAFSEIKYCWECGQKLDWSDSE